MSSIQLSVVIHPSIYTWRMLNVVVYAALETSENMCKKALRVRQSLSFKTREVLIHLDLWTLRNDLAVVSPNLLSGSRFAVVSEVQLLR